MDDFHKRALKNIRDRNEARITEEAQRIREYAGYVLKRIEQGRADSCSLYAADIKSSAERMAAAIGALETLEEALKILATSDNPAPSARPDEHGMVPRYGR